ncbi:hypothetical protein AB0C96_13870 [Streptomyces sp. NPDC048506]|uniref:hypothetical protein n=1 Tax=Streptomyces sp. NPDC048506 TaxID=3155028 RepID=UPI0034148C6E
MPARTPSHVPLHPAPRPAPLLPFLLLVVGLLVALFPCHGGVAGHPHPAGSSAVVSSAPSGAPAGASSGRPVPATVAPEERVEEHHGTACDQGASGHLPQGRPTADPQGAGSGLLAAAVLGTPVRRRSAVCRGGVRRRPARTGRSTLAALCRCRI